jgi:hypothetical protein
MQPGSRDQKRTQYRRMIVRLALSLQWTLEDVRDLDVADAFMIIQELTGRRVMSEHEILQEIGQWRQRVSPSSSARTQAS